MKYYRIDDRTDSCFSANVGKGERIWRPGGCAKCSSLPEGKGPPTNLVVRDEDLPLDVPMSLTSWGFGVIRNDLFAALCPEAFDCLILGSMTTNTGRPIADFFTFSGVEHVIVRGKESSQHRICPSCGALIYSALPFNTQYVTKAGLKSQRSIYEDAKGLLINEEMLLRIDPWRRSLKVKEIKVRDEPLDGLPADLGVFPTREQLVGYKPNLPPWMINHS